MAAYFRLRHVVLVTDDLERAKRDVPAIFGVQLAFEDPHAKDFEVVNAMFPFGLAFIEVMAPMHEGAPSARFLRNGGGQGGYMVAFNCDDPLRRCEHAQRHGVRLAAEATYDGFVCYQMHPRDCRAAMIEYDRSDGEASVHNRLYAAGGYGWQRAVRMHDTYGIDDVVLQSPDATGLAAHWSMLLERPLTRSADGALGLATDMCSIRFAQASGGSREWLSGLRLSVRDPSEIVGRARERGYETTRDTVRMLGITFELAAAGGP